MGGDRLKSERGRGSRRDDFLKGTVVWQAFSFGWVRQVEQKRRMTFKKKEKRAPTSTTEEILRVSSPRIDEGEGRRPLTFLSRKKKIPLRKTMT